MKNILKLFLVLLGTQMYSQQTIVDITNYSTNDLDNIYYKDFTTYQNFTGTWENVNGNITFRLILWKVQHQKYPGNNLYLDLIQGRYLIIQNAGTGNEQVLYDSVKYYPQNGYTSTYVLEGKAINPYSFGGYFSDNNANGGNGIIEGGFVFEKTSTSGTQAHWEAYSDLPLQPGQSFTVPTDCILTKVN